MAQGEGTGMPSNVFTEIGNTGLKQYGGFVDEEFLQQLKWPQDIVIYHEMAENDPTIGAILFASEQLIRNVTWTVPPVSDSQEDREAADFVKSCMDDMSSSWNDTISEILSMLTYGWSWHEIVYKRRLGRTQTPNTKSNYDDGRIGWRKLPIRGQNTMLRFVFDENSILQAMVQSTLPTYEERILPLRKSLLFRPKIVKDNPMGRSVLRNAYRPWYFKKRIEEIEGIGIERDLVGLPILTPPEETDIWNTEDPRMVALHRRAVQIVSNIRRDENEGLVVPAGWKLSLLTAGTGGRRQFDTNQILNRYDQRIAMTILADMVMMGADKVGSFALADVKKSLFSTALESWVNSIADVFNKHAIPRLMDLNGWGNLKTYPKLEHGKIEGPSLPDLADYLNKLVGRQVLLPDDRLEENLRQYAGLPPKETATQRTATKPTVGGLPQDNSANGDSLDQNDPAMSTTDDPNVADQNTQKDLDPNKSSSIGIGDVYNNGTTRS